MPIKDSLKQVFQEAFARHPVVLEDSEVKLRGEKHLFLTVNICNSINQAYDKFVDIDIGNKAKEPVWTSQLHICLNTFFFFCSDW